MNEKQIEIAKTLRGYFIANRIRFKDVAEKMGVTPEYISSILSGRRFIGQKTAYKLNEAYNFSVSWLLTGEGYMFTDEYLGINTDDVETLREKLKAKEAEIMELKRKYSELANKLLDTCDSLGITTNASK